MLGFSGVLEDAEDDELGGPDGSDADLTDESAVEDVILRHHTLVAGDEESLFLGPSVKRSEPPLGAKENADRVGHPRPQLRVIGLEHNPLSSFVNRPL